jgi:hypothetical protein
MASVTCGDRINALKVQIILVIIVGKGFLTCSLRPWMTILTVEAGAEVAACTDTESLLEEGAAQVGATAGR